MFVRTSLTGVITASLAVSALVLSAGAAHAAVTVDPDDTTFTPTTSDIIGVGSDTSQNALFRLAGAYNGTSPAPANRLASFAATSAGEIVLPSATIARPNGSGAGKALLYGAGNNTDVDFARSSSALNSNEVAANLQAFPFALDTLKLAVSNQVPSNAPTTITPAQMVQIYDGTVTDWSAIGGTAGTIKPMIPQSGSGTRSFFVSQLTAANGGNPVTLAASVSEVQEHDPAPIQGDANAVAPFSEGRAGLAGTALRLEGGFSADRALYNVVRAADLGNADIQGLFGEEGFVCSEPARASIEAAGFKQLATPENDGVCGEATQAASSDFTISTGPALDDDTTFTPALNDVIGVGSDTSQNALFRLANAYNAQSPAPANRLATFAALGGGQIPLPSAPVNRPNGSGAGKALLYGAGNNTDVDFARSSSALNSNEVAANLQAFPFALDTLKLAVSNQVPSNAPTTITPAQMVQIYDGTVTDWSAIGGTAGTIKPMIPQSGSGTRSFFVSQLTAANGGNPVTLAASVSEVQEHDPAPIQGDANAVAPFSEGRAGLAGTALRLEGGFSADRALYNVVRAADLGNADIQGLFGEEGFVCSEPARASIEAAGFKQLATPENDGVCGEATQAASSNFTTNEVDEDPIVTSTDLAAVSNAPRRLNLTATVTGTSTPTGTVTFTAAGSDVPLGVVALNGGTATLNFPNANPGTYSITADYTPTADSLYVASSDSATVTVADNPEPEPELATSKLSENFKKSYKGKKATGVVSVSLKGASNSDASGKIVVKEGKKVVAKGKIKKGEATIKLKKKKLGKGKSKLTASWSGNAVAEGSDLSFTVKFK